VTRSDRILVAAAAGALVLAVAAAAVLLTPAADTSGGEDAAFVVTSPVPTGATAGATPAPPSVIVVDVAGAVARPGLVELPGGARIGEAIAAAGGYASDADLETAASINLAQVLADGEQVRVPRIGEASQASAGPAASAGAPIGPGGDGGGAAGGGSGLVDLNTATPEQLEALPGIGAVTVQKIVAARQERPFASLEDAVERGVIHRGQLEDIQGLATAG
jgi:competence protein ComEA